MSLIKYQRPEPGVTVLHWEALASGRGIRRGVRQLGRTGRTGVTRRVGGADEAEKEVESGKEERREKGGKGGRRERRCTGRKRWQHGRRNL
ncbi:hypothetical protein WN48_09038 [Eufriesea mexicana]|nr:hypothetical protein WN48_09038 [Eufriesea mexicana]